MLDLTFLDYQKVFGRNRLKIFDVYGTTCPITDFAILLGGRAENIEKSKTGSWWLYATGWDNDARAVLPKGKGFYLSVGSRFVAARLALSYSSIKLSFSNEVREESGIKEIEYGEYPQWLVDKQYSNELEKAYNGGNMRKTGKSYTTDSINWHHRDTRFKAKQHIEYEYKGKKYIRFVNEQYRDIGEFLSDGRAIENGQVYWVNVEPVVWLVDEENNIAISKYLLFSGVQFTSVKNRYTDFKKTDIKQFMDNYLSKEIECLNTAQLTEDKLLDIDSIFEEALFRMNEISKDNPKIKVLK